MDVKCEGAPSFLESYFQSLQHISDVKILQNALIFVGNMSHDGISSQVALLSDERVMGLV